MAEIININVFLEENGLFFENTKQKLGQVRRNLRPKYLIKAGPNYLVDKIEMEELFEGYIKQKLCKKADLVDGLKNQKRNSEIEGD